MDSIISGATPAPTPLSGTAPVAPPPPALSVVPPPEAAVTLPPLQNLNDPRFFINRELSWLAFNERVLEEASDPQVPALERLKFLAIFSSNLDEFFMIRVAGLKQQLSGHVEEGGADAMSPGEQLSAISTRVHEMVSRQYRLLLNDVLPNLDRAGVKLLGTSQLPAEANHFVADYFAREVFPVLTPIALDPGHPFPHLRNKSLNLAVRFAPATPGARLRYGVVPVPSVLPRLVEVPDSGRRNYVLLEDLIAQYVSQLFPGMPIEGCWAFRVTRNWDLSIDEEEAEDLLVTIEREVRRRDRGSAVRLEIAAGAEQQMVDYLVRALKLGARDVLLHHPYESFDPVVGLIEAAADDPSVLAIKMTLYRTGKDSPVVRALQRAAENGKQVTALVELKARMDEEANILWARALEQAGVHVVYGLIGYKTHAKVALVVRREAGGLRRYVHLGTGNYNPVTARIYEDLSIFTAREDFGADATSLFNLLTGYSKPSTWKKFRVAPLNLKSVVLVQIDLMVRGICVLRPGIPGVSERIKVISVVDRFLEHSRIWFFEAGGKREVYLSSADWMQRNFMRRVEIAFPVEDASVKERIVDEVLGTSLGDNVKARVLRADGQYERVQPGTHGTSVTPLRSQERFMALARKAAAPEAQAAVASHEVFPSTQRRREPRRKKRMG